MKEILYSSTRGGEKGLTASQAILKGLAGDGGLFMPEVIPCFTSVRTSFSSPSSSIRSTRRSILS